MQRKFILEWSLLRAAIKHQQDEGKQVLFTNGVFDLLGAHHVRFLEEAKRWGDLLVVAVNNDASVRAIKGQGRPIRPDHERIEILAALECVDYVTLFPQSEPSEIIRFLKPDIVAKGAWDSGLPEMDTIWAVGARFVSLPRQEGESTSQLIERIKELP